MVVLLFCDGFFVVVGFRLDCGLGFVVVLNVVVVAGIAVVVIFVVVILVVDGLIDVLEDVVDGGGFVVFDCGLSVVTKSTIFVGSVGVATVVSTVWNVKSFIGGVVTSNNNSSWAILTGVVVSIGRKVVVDVVVVDVVVVEVELVVGFFFVVILCDGFEAVDVFVGLAVVLITKWECLCVVDCCGFVVVTAVFVVFVDTLTGIWVVVVCGSCLSVAELNWPSSFVVVFIS